MIRQNESIHIRFQTINICYGVVCIGTPKIDSGLTCRPIQCIYRISVRLGLINDRGETSRDASRAVNHGGQLEWLGQKRETYNQSLTGLPEECRMEFCVQTLMPFESRDVALGQHALILFGQTENGTGSQYSHGRADEIEHLILGPTVSHHGLWNRTVDSGKQ